MPPPYPARQIGTLFRRDERSIQDKYGQSIAPFFRIEISNQSQHVLFSAEANISDGGYDLNGLIVSDIEWEENDCQASMLRMTVQNVDMTLHERRLFAEGNSVDLWMGYDGYQPDYMGRAIIVELAPEFGADSMPKIEITAYDISHFMMEEGKAEIQKEGTTWFERHRVAPQTNSNNQRERTVLNNIRSTTAQERNDRSSLPANLQGNIPQGSIDTLGREAQAPNTEIRAFTAPTTNTQTNTPTTRTRLRQARIPRQRHNRGKVWRNLRDDEIVNKIYESYGIVPYTEALNQRARSRTEERLVTHRNRGELDNVENTIAGALRRRTEQARSGGPIVTPEETVDIEGPELNLAARPIRYHEVSTTQTRVTVEIGGRRVVQKAGTSDWEFIKKLAKSHGFIVFVFYYYETKQWVGYWGSPHNVPQHVVYDLRYNMNETTTLKSFRPKISMRGQKTEIDLLFVDPVTRRRQRLRVAMENISSYTPEFRGPDAMSTIDEPLGNGPEVVLTIHGQRVDVHADRRFRSMDDARRWLMSFWYQHASEFCEGEGECIIGLPEIHCRHKHKLSGFGRYSGDYFFTRVAHKMGTGSAYSTTFSCYRISDMLLLEPDQEMNALTVESEELGQLSPAAITAESEWRRAGGS